MRLLKFFTLFAYLIVWPAHAYLPNELKEQLSPKKGERFKSRVIEVVDGDTVILTSGLSVRLVGLQAPKIALNRKNFKEWPLGYKAKQTLSDITLNKDVMLYYGGREMDRYGRALAHLFLEDGTWIQGEMLKRGMARVYSFADNRSLIADMYEIEKEARIEKRGIWNLGFYKIKPEQNSGKFTNSFQVISGTVADVATVRNRTYLNFGDDYKTDFTIVIPNKVKTMFEKLAINLTDLKGKNIIVRGWLKYYNGPSIDLSHPEQMIIE